MRNKISLHNATFYAVNFLSTFCDCIFTAAFLSTNIFDLVFFFLNNANITPSILSRSWDIKAAENWGCSNFYFTINGPLKTRLSLFWLFSFSVSLWLLSNTSWKKHLFYDGFLIFLQSYKISATASQLLTSSGNPWHDGPLSIFFEIPK